MKKKKKKKIIILGAAGRDFHNFNVCFRDDPGYEVVAFTATQIPFISGRIYPAELSGPLYPMGIPIIPEERLAEIIKREGVEAAAFAYSDVSNDYIMHRASVCTALNADFLLLGTEKTMLKSRKPVISVCAVRTGCGKSGVTKYTAKTALRAGHKVAVIRHPMPYGDLIKETAQKFLSIDDIKNAGCTIEEMEEYEPLVSEGIPVLAGVDYSRILGMAEEYGDIIIWDGGNNDTPFIRPDLELVVADPLRAGDELRYYHGEVNLRRAECIILNKANTASVEEIKTVRKNIMELNPEARVITTASEVSIDAPIAGKKVLVIEDGPTLTHGGMDYGAGIIAARKFKAEPVEVRQYAVGSIKETFSRYPRLKNLLPATGYSKEQIKELEETINSTPCDAVLAATPIDLTRIIDIKKPYVRVRYDIEEMDSPGLIDIITGFLKGLR